MTSPLFWADFAARIHGALSRAKEAAHFQHHGLAGTAREVFVQEMLRPVLTPLVVMGTGKISDHLGTLSRESDVILYSAETLPPLVLAEGFGMYPADASLYSIEVKTRLTKTELRDSITKHRQLRSLTYFPHIPQVIPALFAYGSDLSRKSELDRYRELDPEADTRPAIPVFCVVGKGYWWFHEHGWKFHPASDDHDEVIDFICGISNTIQIMLDRKGRPPLGRYIVKERGIELIPHRAPGTAPKVDE